MKRLEGHNTWKFKSKDDLNEENSDITSTEPKKPESSDQQKPEGSEAQKTRNIKDRHGQDKIDVTKNKRRRERDRNKTNRTL